MDNFKPIFLGKDYKAIQNAESELTNKVNGLNFLLTQWYDFFKKPAQISEVKKLLNLSIGSLHKHFKDNYLKECQVQEKLQTINGVSFDIDKMIELGALQIPNFLIISKQIAEAGQRINSTDAILNEDLALTYKKTDSKEPAFENGKFIIPEKLLQRIDEMYSISTKTQEQNIVIEFLNDVLSLFSTMFKVIFAKQFNEIEKNQWFDSIMKRLPEPLNYAFVKNDSNGIINYSIRYDIFNMPFFRYVGTEKKESDMDIIKEKIWRDNLASCLNEMPEIFKNGKAYFLKDEKGNTHQGHVESGNTPSYLSKFLYRYFNLKMAGSQTKVSYN